jgi:hypothetical protein
VVQPPVNLPEGSLVLVLAEFVRILEGALKYDFFRRTENKISFSVLNLSWSRGGRLCL